MGKNFNKSRYLLSLIARVVKIVFRCFPILIKGLRVLIHEGVGLLFNLKKRVKRLFRFSISFKITVVYAFMFTLLLIIISMGILAGFYFYLINQTSNEVEKASALTMDAVIEDSKIDHTKLGMIAQREDIIIIIYDANATAMYSSNDNLEKPLFQNKLNQIQLTKELDNSILFLTRKITINDDVYYIQVEKNFYSQMISLIILAGILFIANGLAIVLILLTGAKVSKRMLSPIERMTDTVKEISVQDLSKRLDVSGAQDELKDLAETFNAMIDHIQDSYERQDRFVSDASHELRTPIAVIQGYVNLLDRWGKNDEQVLDESITAIKDEAENMKELTEKLLFLARSDKNQLMMEKQDFNVKELVDEVMKETLLISNRHDIISHHDDHVILHGDRKLLKQALRIFIDNGVKFTPKGGTIKLSTQLTKSHVLFVIEDTGIGISKEDLPLIFDRFYRSDKSRTKETGGYGLGLSIAKLIIDMHHGKVEVQSTMGVGTKFTIMIPIKKGR